MRSDKMKSGVQRIPHRSLFKALGLTEEELSRPIIGIVNSQNEVIPGHLHLDTVAEAVPLFAVPDETVFVDEAPL